MRFFPIFAAAILALVSAPAAHADEKSDAILKEVRLRAKNQTSFSVKAVSGQRGPSLYIWYVRPDRYRLEITSGNQTVAVIRKGNRKVVVEGAKATPLPSQIEDKVNYAVYLFTVILSTDFEVSKSTYVTQKMLNETTLVDVIDISGANSQDSIRLYIDNNSQVRKIVTRAGTITFLNYLQDEPIPDEKFAIPKDKS